MRTSDLESGSLHGNASNRAKDQAGTDNRYRSELQVPFNSRLHLDMALCRADMHTWQCLRQPSPQAYFESLGRWMVCRGEMSMLLGRGSDAASWGFLMAVSQASSAAAG